MAVTIDSEVGTVSYTILSFCGGGIRGLASATLLQRLWPDPGPPPTADLLAGTSTGTSIISWLLAGQSPAQICDNYLTSGVNFFTDPSTNPLAPAYDIDDVIAAQIALHKGDPKLSTFGQSMVMTSFNVGQYEPPPGKSQPWKPLLLHNVPGAPDPADIGIAEAVASSSAMPGMMGSVGGNIDGAFASHDPTLAAIALAMSSGIAIEDIYAICFGTGFMANWIASDTSNWGAQQWQNGDGNGNSQTPPLLINGTVAPVLNATLNGTSTSYTQTLSALMLGDRYSYLNPCLDRYIPENDANQADLQYLQDQCGLVDISAAQQLIANHWS
jgi:patatin-like phospholipase/acyl hydrolase